MIAALSVAYAFCRPGSSRALLGHRLCKLLTRSIGLEVIRAYNGGYLREGDCNSVFGPPIQPMRVAMEREAVGRPMEILLVEDSLTAARITMGALRNGGIEHRLTWLSDGNDAVAFLRREGKYARAPHPDLVLLDLMLPGRDGREVLADLRANPETCHTPVIVMTGTVEAPIAEAVENLNVEGFLKKPVNLDAFLSLVEKLKDFWKADMILPTVNGEA